MYSLQVFAVILGFFNAGVRSTSKFTGPLAAGPEFGYLYNPIYQLGDNIEANWNTDIRTVDLVVFQDYPATDQGFLHHRMILDDSRINSFNWQLDLGGFTPSAADGRDAVMHFGLYNHADGVVEARSHYFNVTASKDSTSKAAALDDSTRDPQSTGKSSSTVTIAGSTQDSAADEDAVVQQLQSSIDATMGALKSFGQRVIRLGASLRATWPNSHDL